ncbi:hypothetical protein E6H15_01615, partial [Candidatus Bathyarchaeota archaeon]
MTHAKRPHQKLPGENSKRERQTGSPRISVIGGTGDEGYGLALRWAKQGYEVVIGSRDPEKARSAANKIRDS